MVGFSARSKRLAPKELELEERWRNTRVTRKTVASGRNMNENGITAEETFMNTFKTGILGRWT